MKKTLKKHSVAFIVILLSTLAFIVAFIYMRTSLPLGAIGDIPVSYFDDFVYNTHIGEAKIRLADNYFYTAVADEEEEQRRGLSGIISMEDNQGMIFIFPKEGRYSFWMKDMFFALDMVWLDRNGKVVYIAQNVPTRDASEELTHPGVEARMVLELKAGMTERIGLEVGDRAQIEFLTKARQK